MERGIKVHSRIENFLRHAGASLPRAAVVSATARKVIRGVKKYRLENPGHTGVEEQWGMSANFNQTRWDDWVHCVVRLKLDAYTLHPSESRLVLYDWKTGKNSESMASRYNAQLELYAVGGFAQFREVEDVTAKLVFVDLGVVVEHNFARRELGALKAQWARYAAPMLADRRFAPTPSMACRWCHFRANNEGPCKF